MTVHARIQRGLHILRIITARANECVLRIGHFQYIYRAFACTDGYYHHAALNFAHGLIFVL